MSTLHTIKAYLHDNVLTENPDDFVARVSAERSLSIADICESAASRGGADISAAAMEHAVNLWLKEMGYRLCDGFGINAGWFTASTLIRGIFDSPVENFNPDKHSVLFAFHQGALLRKELEQVSVEILGVAATALFVAQVYDVKSDSTNNFITPHRNLKISGVKIKIAGDNEENGVYFVNQTSDERTKIDTGDLVINNPSELVILVPELSAGTYKLEIKTQYTKAGGTIQLKEPRTVLFDKILTVI